VAVITGASRGLGAGMAAHWAAAGLHLGLCARHRPDLVAATRPRVHQGLVEPAEAPLAAAVDVTDFDQVAAFAEAVVRRFGRIDLWVNNAGLLAPLGPLSELDPDLAMEVVDVNLTGALFGSMVFARHLRSRPGSGVLVNISSGAAVRPYYGWAAYCASKAGLDMATETLVQEEVGHGLRAYSVAPGLVDTDMQAAIRATAESRFPDVHRYRQAKEDGAFNSPAWVAEKLLELAFGDEVTEEVCVRIPAEPVAATGG
jgi:NAD(P)-dependent dehydrogenase (short-subunit alcohol dehydrogenase family)